MQQETKLIDQLFNAMKPVTELFRLNAIHLDKPIKTSKEIKNRITEGDFVRIENGKLVWVEPGKPHTHCITEVKGTLSNSLFEIHVIDCRSLELSIVKI